MTYETILKQWNTNRIESIADLDTALDNFRILFAYNSNVIENPETTYHNTREVFENGKVVGYTGNLRTLFEIQNQKKCYDMLRERIIAKEPISPKLILDIHKELMQGCYDETRYEKGERPGEFKHHEYVTGDGIGCTPEEVEKEIEKLCIEVNNAKSEKILTIAAYLHLRFESIHPFADGNGRVGRTLMNYYLMTNDYPPTIIYGEDKETYYMALAIYDKSEQIDGFVKFLEEQTIKTWSKKEAPKKSLNLFL